MKKATSKLLSLILGAALAVTSLVGIAACGETGNTGDTGDPNIRLVYDMYVENCAAKGEEALTYEDWLASIKGEDGEDGKDGVTPHIGANGNWYIGEEDTHIPATGAKGDDGDNGVTPHIGTNGNWYIGEEDTHIPATGAKGDDGDKGDDGNGWLYGDQAPADTLGKNGDLYLNYTDWTVYTKDGGHWTERGSIKGEKGDKGDSATSGETEPSDAIKTWDNVTISKDAAYTVDVSGVTEGLYWLIADTETQATYNTLKVQKGSLNAYDMCTVKSNGFRAVVSVGGEGDIVMSTTSDTAITANLELVKYEPITLTSGVEIEVPVCSDGQTLFPLQIDSNLLGKSVTVTASLPTGCDLSSVGFVRNTDPLPSDGLDPATSLRKNKNYVNTLTIESTTKECYIQNSSTNLNVIIKIEVTAS